jgi:hypothetical protein
MTMQDQHFYRGWHQDAGDFAADFQQTLNGLGRYRRTRSSDDDNILDRHRVEPARHGLSAAAKASLRGLAASVITFALWTAAMLVMTPAPGLASTLDPAAPAVAVCASPVTLA